ncbi:gelsolin, cytoplasmic-like [Colias croceus]|uniref:gelsolin, cytoplasmic-like n=1 Tax=Colias crocea TaxID=72248 RepID=UPI001E27C391|nr:gelsolin, cytoplasmic-like [Colias croceus]
MEHPAFVDAGAEAGLEIWTIDKFEPVPIDRKKYGKFYNGDSYIVLKTTGENNSTLYYDVHFWLGSKTTQDKKGSAAIWTVTLDDQLGGKAVHHREVQGHESSSFVGYFQPAIRYLEGGNESGFNEVETNAGAEKRLLRLSGCDNMRIEEVPADASSLTANNCFILEVEHDIFVLMPQGAKATQRRKIISVANNLRDQEHNGRATIEIIDEFSSNDDFAMFFEALGSGSRDELIEGEESIAAFSRESMTTVYLYRVLYDDDVELDALSKPFKQSQLESDNIYILDTPCSGVYIWIGNDVDAEVKKNYNDIVLKYLDVKNYPAWVNVTRVSEGSENSNFKQYFHNWQTIVTSSVRALVSEFDVGYFSSDADESANAAKFIGKSAAARGYMPDDGSGEMTVFRIAEEPEDITELISKTPILYQNDVYVIQYKYDSDGKDAYILYTWVGEKTGKDTKTAAKEYCNKLEEELEGDVNNVTVPQGKETKHFLKLFKGKLGILYGGKNNEYSPDNFNHSYQDDGIRLFKVEGIELEEDMRIVQVPETTESLENDDVFILETPEVVYVWNGKESNEKEQAAALQFTKTVVGDEREVMAVIQGEESYEFWTALGGAPATESISGWQQAVTRRITTPVTLTAVNVTIGGKVNFEELPPDFKQTYLSDDSVYIVDGGEELYFWKGNNTPERVKAAKDKIIEEYLEDDGLDRTVDTAIVVSVKQGKEPANFKKLFREWDDEMWENQTSYEDLKNETKAGNTKE